MKKPFQNSRLLPVLIAGTLVRMDPNSIDKDQWTIHHGKTADGTKVNSAKSCIIGDSVLVSPGEGAPAVSFKKADLEVFATQYLQGQGFTVTPKAPAQQT